MRFSGSTWNKRPAAVAAALLACILSAPGWEIRSFEGREHVPLSEISDFYGLGAETSPDPNTRRLQNGSRELVVTRSSREILINGVRHWLAFPVAEDGGRFFISRLDLGKTIDPALRPSLIAGYPQVTTVVLDAGHGGMDNGAKSPYEFEKNFALDVARRVRDRLQKSGVRVLMTRNSDTFVELQDRAAFASRLKNVIFVSIHFNAADWNQSANGFEIYCVTPRGAPSTAYEQTRLRDMIEENGNDHDLHSFALANTVYHAMLGKTDMSDRGVKRARFAVLRLAGVPAILIEGGFLTNPSDARKIASKPWRENYAAAISTGILEYKKLAEMRIAPRELADYRNPGSSPTPVAATAAKPAAVSGVTLRELPD